MNDDKAILDLAKKAITEGRNEDARSLLQPLMKRNVIEAFFLASNVAKSQEQALKFLQHALTLDPDNKRVHERLTELKDIYAGQNPITIEELTHDSPTVSDEKIIETTKLFEKYGWQVVGQRKGYAQFMRKRLSIFPSFLLGLIFNFIGVILLIVNYVSAEKEHVFIETEGEEINIAYSDNEVQIVYPEQALIFLEKTRSISFIAAFFYCLLGLATSSLIITLLVYQSDFIWNLLISR